MKKSIYMHRWSIDFKQLKVNVKSAKNQFHRFLCSLCTHLGLGDALLCRRQRQHPRGRHSLHEPRAPHRRRREMLERVSDPSIHLDSCRTHDGGAAGKWAFFYDVTKFWVTFQSKFCHIFF